MDRGEIGKSGPKADYRFRDQWWSGNVCIYLFLGPVMLVSACGYSCRTTLSFIHTWCLLWFGYMGHSNCILFRYILKLMYWQCDICIIAPGGMTMRGTVYIKNNRSNMHHLMTKHKPSFMSPYMTFELPLMLTGNQVFGKIRKRSLCVFYWKQHHGWKSEIWNDNHQCHVIYLIIPQFQRHTSWWESDVNYKLDVTRAPEAVINKRHVVTCKLNRLWSCYCYVGINRI